jgi:hypothetical protein
MKLFVTDEELIERLGVPEKDARMALHELDRNPKNGFPPKLKLWGDRRYWPAVCEYLDQVYKRRIGAARVAPEDRSPQSAAALTTLRNLQRRDHARAPQNRRPWPDLAPTQK